MSAYVQIAKFLISEYGDDAAKKLQEYLKRRRDHELIKVSEYEGSLEFDKAVKEALRQLDRDPDEFFGPRIGAEPPVPPEPTPEPEPEPTPEPELSYGEPFNGPISDDDLKSEGGFVSGDIVWSHWQVRNRWIVRRAGEPSPSQQWIAHHTIE